MSCHEKLNVSIKGVMLAKTKKKVIKELELELELSVDHNISANGDLHASGNAKC